MSVIPLNNDHVVAVKDVSGDMRAMCATYELTLDAPDGTYKRKYEVMLGSPATTPLEEAKGARVKLTTDCKVVKCGGCTMTTHVQDFIWRLDGEEIGRYSQCIMCSHRRDAFA